VSSPVTNLVKATAAALKRAGILEEVTAAKGTLTVKIAYKKKRPVLLGLQLVSRPGLRIYLGVEDLESKRGPSLLLMTTPKGVVTSREAVKQRLGGEVLAEVW
jgi:small subunit ribosomal protein S8